jgi:hypothetical protein
MPFYLRTFFRVLSSWVHHIDTGLPPDELREWLLIGMLGDGDASPKEDSLRPNPDNNPTAAPRNVLVGARASDTAT